MTSKSGKRYRNWTWFFDDGSLKRGKTSRKVAITVRDGKAQFTMLVLVELW
jgi:hypothetical protein